MVLGNYTFDVLVGRSEPIFCSVTLALILRLLLTTTFHILFPLITIPAGFFALWISLIEFILCRLGM